MLKITLEQSPKIIKNKFTLINNSELINELYKRIDREDESDIVEAIAEDLRGIERRVEERVLDLK